jgi:hypothetical protein
MSVIQGTSFFACISSFIHCTEIYLNPRKKNNINILCTCSTLWSQLKLNRSKELLNFIFNWEGRKVYSIEKELVESIIGMYEPENNITLDNNNALGDSIEKSFSRKRGFRRNLKRNVAKLDWVSLFHCYWPSKKCLYTAVSLI